MTTQTARVDVYTRVTNGIVEQLERGVRPWFKPWNAEHTAGRITRPLRHSGINILTLWMSAELQGFVSPFWMTFRQALELGGHVKEGEHGSPVVYASTFKKKDQDDDGQETEEDIPFLKEYTVFSANTNADIRIGGNRAFHAMDASGDWGNLCASDADQNREALVHGSRILSVYGEGATRFWIITESDRSVTTLLLPQDY